VAAERRSINRVLARFGDIVQHPLYAAGLALDGVGFVVSLVALHTLPLYAAEAVLAASVGVTAGVCGWWLRKPPRRVETTAVVVLLVGLGTLALTAGQERPSHLPGGGGVGLLLAAVALAGWLVFTVGHTSSGAHIVAGLAGAGFGGVGITVRALDIPNSWWRLALQPNLYALVVFGAAAVVGQALALQHGTATTVAAVLFAVETLVPAVIGILVLGDRPRHGTGSVAAVGFAVTVAAILMLSRYAVAAPDAAD
jgi:drug/metabolite transporter (DMT)-like permease